MQTEHLSLIFYELPIEDAAIQNWRADKKN